MYPLSSQKTLRPETNQALEKEWRIVVAGYFRQTASMPPKEDWGGVGGTIVNITKEFNSSEAQGRVERVLEYVVLYADRGQVYKGERLKGQ
jgi:hypothetical protein